ncbi:MAG TPA: hypothetical protein VG897_01610, partial [Terriglobales bacterium]|nr:hypothetical protein [Terriglobales bacterium]
HATSWTRTASENQMSSGGPNKCSLDWRDNSLGQPRGPFRWCCNIDAAYAAERLSIEKLRCM